MRLCLLALVFWLPGGCPPSGGDEGVGTTEFDGQWQLQSTSGRPPACISIAAGRIATFDEGCAGDFGLVVSLLPVSVSGDTVAWVFTLSTGGTTQTITLTGQIQDDGSIRGTVQAIVAGTPVLSTFTMTRR